MSRDATIDQCRANQLIHQRFTDQMEVSVRLVGEVAARSAMEHEFSRLGLAPLGDGGWTGLINTTTDQLERLNHHLLAQENLIGDFSLHKPGLELLISSLLDDGGPPS